MKLRQAKKLVRQFEAEDIKYAMTWGLTMKGRFIAAFSTVKRHVLKRHGPGMPGLSMRQLVAICARRDIETGNWREVEEVLAELRSQPRMKGPPRIFINHSVREEIEKVLSEKGESQQ